MRIRVDDIKDKGLNLDYQERAEDLQLLADLEAAGECRFTAPVQLRGRAIRVAEVVEVEGDVSTNVRLSCGRCINDFETPIASHFALTYAREVPPVEDEDGEEIELNADELGLILFHGDEIDLSDAVAEQIIMDLPLRPLCHEGCKGLCPHCGADLNVRECGCTPAEFDTRFAALKNFKPGK